VIAWEAHQLGNEGLGQRHHGPLGDLAFRRPAAHDDPGRSGPESCPHGVGWCGFPSGSFTVAPQLLGGRAADDLADECGEVTGSAPIAAT